jgi:restriction system protein
MSDSLILDYTEFVEMACVEEDGVYSSRPSVADTVKSAHRFLDPAEVPPDPFAVPYPYSLKVMDRWLDYFRSRTELFGSWYHLKDCPYCQTPLGSVYEPEDRVPEHLRQIMISACPTCGWWESDEELHIDQDTDSGSYRARSIHRRAVLREFAVAGIESPIDSLRQHIIKHPSALHLINPSKLEKLVASVFGEYMQCEAIHLGGPRDGGIDVLLVDADRRYVIQVKRRQSSTAAESVSGIREFLGAMVLRGEMKGLFVSTAPHFSSDAVAAAAGAKEKGLVEYIDLITPRRLLDMCGLVSVDRLPPWKIAVSGPEDLVDHVNDGFVEFRALAMGSP